jgi:hypothetical protein
LVHTHRADQWASFKASTLPGGAQSGPLAAGAQSDRGSLPRNSSTIHAIAAAASAAGRGTTTSLQRYKLNLLEKPNYKNNMFIFSSLLNEARSLGYHITGARIETGRRCQATSQLHHSPCTAPPRRVERARPRGTPPRGSRAPGGAPRRSGYTLHLKKQTLRKPGYPYFRFRRVETGWFLAMGPLHSTCTAPASVAWHAG